MNNKKLLYYFFTTFFCFLSMTLATAKPQYHHPQEFMKQIAQSKDKGKRVYEHFCALCHAKEPKIQIGAPRIGVKGDWQDRRKKGIDRMLAVSDAGLNAMPSRGGCFECTDEALKAAIVYMLPKDEM